MHDTAERVHANLTPPASHSSIKHVKVTSNHMKCYQEPGYFVVQLPRMEGASGSFPVPKLVSHLFSFDLTHHVSTPKSFSLTQLKLNVTRAESDSPSSSLWILLPKAIHRLIGQNGSQQEKATVRNLTPHSLSPSLPHHSSNISN